MDYKYPTPQLLFKAICNTIRSKTGNSDEIPHQNIPDELDNIIMTEEEYEYREQEAINIISGNIQTFRNNTTTIINYYSFNSCKNIITIDLPECISVYNDAFKNCTNLTTVNLPKCTSVGSSTFYNCTRLTTVNLPKCTSIFGNSCFYNCTNLTIIDLPECISIGAGSCFYNCTRLTTVNLPKCTKIDWGAFYNCTRLTTVNLPKCTSIGGAAFENSGLKTIIFGANRMVSIINLNPIPFRNTPMANGTGYIYVPDDLVNSYKTDTNWSTYANQIKPISELPSNLKEEYGYD